MHAVTLLLILACVDLMHLDVVLPPIPFTLRITFSCFSQIILRVRVGFHLCPRSIRLATVEVTSAVTSSPTQQICLCGSELMRRDVVIVT